MCTSALPAGMYTHCICVWFPIQKRVMDPLELGLSIVVNHHVCAGNRTQVLVSARVALHYRATSPVPKLNCEKRLIVGWIHEWMNV